MFASEIEIFMSASTDEALAEKRQVMMLNLIVHKGKSVDERPQSDADEEKYDSCLGEVFRPVCSKAGCTKVPLTRQSHFIVFKLCSAEINIHMI